MALADLQKLQQIVAQIYTSDVGVTPPGIDAAQAYLAGSTDLQWGGDVSDIFQHGDGATSFLVADVSGKGLEAAQQTSLVKYAIRAYASLGYGPARCLQYVNTLYLETCRYERRESFVSIFFASLDRSRRTLTYASAGHDPALLVRSSGTVVELKANGPLIGVVDGAALYEERRIDVRPEDSIVCFTDGVTESRSPDGSMLGFERTADIVTRNAGESAYDQARGLLDTMRAHCGGDRCNDDVAILALRIRRDLSAGSSLLVA